jgi:hypothetical protein
VNARSDSSCLSHTLGGATKRRTASEETTMSSQTRWSRTAAATIALAAAWLFLGASPANAGPAPEPIDQTVPVQICPTIDALTQPLRAAGFSAQAAKNYAVLTRRDCLHGI